MASAASTSRSTAAWPAPAPELGASLLLAFAPPASSPAAVPKRRTVLVVGAGRLASVRTFACLEAGLRVAVLAPAAPIDAELEARISGGQVEKLEWPACFSLHQCEQDEQRTWANYTQEELPAHVLDDLLLVCITDTISSTSATTTTSTRSPASALALRSAFFKLRIPVNVADYPALSDFHFPATYRFPLSHSTSLATTSSSSSTSPHQTASPLQIAITTNGNSCRLASRIRREIVTKLPKSVGSAVARIGQLRAEARRVDRERDAREAPQLLQKNDGLHLDDFEQGEREEGWSASQLNKPVPQILASASSSRCTSLNKTRKRPFLPPFNIATGKPLHPSQMPLTPPATPPAHLSQMEAFLSSKDGAEDEIVPPSLTRMRFIAQISEYWPIERLAALSETEGKRVISLYAQEVKNQPPPQYSTSISSGQNHQTLSAGNIGQSSAGAASTSVSINGNALPNGPESEELVASRHELPLASTSSAAVPPTARGKIFLLGSGPGSPALLTMAAHTLLTKHATLILSDKLVPSEILALIPPSIPLVIAKKFPGNAEGAQNELMDLAHQGALRGETVVRLKQGDPYVYGRGGEEVLFFRERGFEAVVVPGISSAFAAPLMAGIPVTQRGVSESVTVTTGVGRKGKGVTLPGYERSRTLTVLMGVARLEGVVTALTSASGQEGNGREGGGRQGASYPPYCPIAIIEKASSPDQRMVASTLEGIVDALERAGDQRPPGMMIIGWSVLALEGKGDVQVLDGVEGMMEAELKQVDRQRVARWLGESRSIVREGLDSSWSDLVALQEKGASYHGTP